MPALIYVCVRCDRHAASGRAGHGAGLALARALAEQTRGDLDIRQVACLSGCPQPCNVTLRGAGRQTLRFGEVGIEDGAALLAFARAYWTLAPGTDAVPAMPESLRAKLKQNTPSAIVPAVRS